MRLWIVGAICLSGALFLLALRGLIPDLLSIVVANTGMVAGFVFIYLGNRSHSDLKPAGSWQWGLVVATAVLFLYFTYVQPNLSARIIVFAVVMSIARMASAVVLLRSRNAHDRIVRWVLAAAFAFTACFSMFRAVLTAVMDPIAQNFLQLTHPIHTWTFAVELGMNLMLAFCLPVLLLGKTHNRLAQSEQRYHSLYASMTEGLALHELVRDASGRPAGGLCLHRRQPGLRIHSRAAQG